MKWTEEKNNRLRELYPLHSASKVAFLMASTRQAIKSRAQKIGIKKGGSGRFPKGHIPANKGAKGLKIPGSEKGWFKKGQICKNKKEVGSISRLSDGYWWIKIEDPKKWVQLHHHIWEEKNGPIEPGMLIIFKDKNQNNLKIENLQKISKQDHIAKRRAEDAWIVSLIERDKDKRQLIIDKHPRLIELKRKVLELNKEMKNGKEN